MRAYSASSEESLRARNLLKDWASEGFLTEAQYQRMEQETVCDLRRTNIFLRIVLFFFTLIILLAAGGLFFQVFLQRPGVQTTGVVLLVFAAICYCGVRSQQRTIPVETSGSEKVRVEPLDDFNLTVDLIKADVEGSEVALLRGARKTIARCRPVLYLENGRPENEAELLALINELGYRIYSHKVPLFNPKNFRGNKLNVFGMFQSSMVLCVPRERYDLRPITKTLQRVRVS